VGLNVGMGWQRRGCPCSHEQGYRSRSAGGGLAEDW
jgi:hypothetical protein